MSTRIESESGEELWGPDTFGKYSIDKIRVIAEIMKGVFKDTPITFVNKGKDSDDVYTKIESNNLFVFKSDFNTLAGDLVKTLTASYLRQLSETEGVASANDIKVLTKVANFLTRVCFNQTYTEIKDLSTMNIVAIPDRLQQVETQQVSVDTRINHMMGVIYEINRDGSFSSTSKVATKEEVSGIGNRLGSGSVTVRGASDVIDAVNRLDRSVVALESISNLVNNLSTTVNALANTVNRLDTLLGSEPLRTNAKTITGAINELKR